MSVEISRRVLTKKQFEANRDQAQARQPPSVPGSLKKKYRWLQGIVRNPTEFEVIVGESYFNSGRFDKALPSSLGSFKLGTFTACNGDNTFFTGVSGGLTYKINLDENNSFDFSIGFTNPSAGSCKAGLVASDDPEDGYNDADKTAKAIETDIYEAKDVDGNTVKFKFSITAAAGGDQRPLFQINELRYYD
ncbi:hypothetical protein BDV93DRAFT_560828 [Ceratobasidium sp. AG-I]|nr:hypothetical protein BDV93DRAFT_560828 [Ceratobasidium sp. AG-I]